MHWRNHGMEDMRPELHSQDMPRWKGVNVMYTWWENLLSISALLKVDVCSSRGHLITIQCNWMMYCRVLLLYIYWLIFIQPKYSFTVTHVCRGEVWDRVSWRLCCHGYPTFYLRSVNFPVIICQRFHCALCKLQFPSLLLLHSFTSVNCRPMLYTFPYSRSYPPVVVPLTKPND